MTIWPIHESVQKSLFFLHFTLLNLAPNFYNLLLVNHHIQQKNRTEAWKPCPTPKMELLAKIVNGWKMLTIFSKHSILSVWKSSEYATVGKYKTEEHRIGAFSMLLNWKHAFAIVKSNVLVSPHGSKYSSSHKRCSIKEDVLSNFANLTGKHPCQSLVFAAGDNHFHKFYLPR